MSSCNKTDPEAQDKQELFPLHIARTKEINNLLDDTIDCK